ncbi:dihydroorotate dehydrogenase B (NAD(+)), electron transfer subunit [Peptococcaceae bacterium CEB3]|nr:dihydroorotate dehydrogenase B (NAD(+)), electron transfer subunit [Peptococcaceae bacterium CEB3]
MPLSYEEIISHESQGNPAEGLRRLVLRGSVAATARPGQFLHVRVSDRLEPLLRRPLSIASIDRTRGEVTLLYRVRGRGTETLARKRSGERLDVLGPLGNGFSIPEKGELWLVAGGIGIFPLYALARAGLAAGLKVHLFWGGESRNFLQSAGLAEWQDLGIPLHLSTMDGSLGDKGTVMLPLGKAEDPRSAANRLSGQPLPALSVAVCGPRGMMQAVAELGSARGWRVEVSLEERMACGVGACLGCSVTVRDERGRLTNRKVCQDGPVFPGKEVVWNGAR